MLPSFFATTWPSFNRPLSSPNRHTHTYTHRSAILPTNSQRIEENFVVAMIQYEHLKQTKLLFLQFVREINRIASYPFRRILIRKYLRIPPLRNITERIILSTVNGSIFFLISFKFNLFIK